MLLDKSVDSTGKLGKLLDKLPANSFHSNNLLSNVFNINLESKYLKRYALILLILVFVAKLTF
jgi:hypothetical protein